MPSVDIGLTYLSQGAEGNGEAGDLYAGLDRFGRVRDQRWLRSDAISMPLDRFQYSYDRSSNRTARNNLATTGLNETYGYDLLNQLTSFVRGSHSQSWGLDALGNWTSLSTDGAPAVGRSHNRQNQVTEVGGAMPAFDANGNTTTDEAGRTLAYDAWNRLTQVTSGGTTTVSFRYDALNRRIREDYAGTADDRELYYSAGWQVLEERLSETAAAKLQYVWSPVYVDALVRRDRDSNDDGSLEQVLYVQQDANWNVTALVDTAGTVVERYLYDPYGGAIVLDGDWGARGGSLYAWAYLHQGGRFETVSALYHFRNRDLSPILGRWVQRDPIEFAAGDGNLYGLTGGNPIVFTDPLGLQTTPSNEQLYQQAVRQCEYEYQSALTYGNPDNRAQYKKQYEDCLARARALRSSALRPGSARSGPGPRPGGGGVGVLRREEDCPAPYRLSIR